MARPHGDYALHIKPTNRGIEGASQASESIPIADTDEEMVAAAIGSDEREELVDILLQNLQVSLSDIQGVPQVVGDDAHLDGASPRIPNADIAKCSERAG